MVLSFNGNILKGSINVLQINAGKLKMKNSFKLIEILVALSMTGHDPYLKGFFKLSPLTTFKR